MDAGDGVVHSPEHVRFQVHIALIVQNIQFTAHEKTDAVQLVGDDLEVDEEQFCRRSRDSGSVVGGAKQL